MSSGARDYAVPHNHRSAHWSGFQTFKSNWEVSYRLKVRARQSTVGLSTWPWHGQVPESSFTMASFPTSTLNPPLTDDLTTTQPTGIFITTWISSVKDLDVTGLMSTSSHPCRP